MFRGVRPPWRGTAGGDLLTRVSAAPLAHRLYLYIKIRDFFRIFTIIQQREGERILRSKIPPSTTFSILFFSFVLFDLLFQILILIFLYIILFLFILIIYFPLILALVNE